MNHYSYRCVICHVQFTKTIPAYSHEGCAITRCRRCVTHLQHGSNCKCSIAKTLTAGSWSIDASLIAQNSLTESGRVASLLKKLQGRSDSTRGRLPAGTPRPIGFGAVAVLGALTEAITVLEGRCPPLLYSMFNRALNDVVTTQNDYHTNSLKRKEAPATEHGEANRLLLARLSQGLLPGALEHVKYSDTQGKDQSNKRRRTTTDNLEVTIDNPPRTRTPPRPSMKSAVGDISRAYERKVAERRTPEQLTHQEKMAIDQLDNDEYIDVDLLGLILHTTPEEISSLENDN